MEPVTLMLIAGGVFLLFAILTIANFAMGANKTMDGDLGSFKGMFVGHIVLGGITSIAGIVTIAGFIWFLVEKLA